MGSAGDATLLLGYRRPYRGRTTHRHASPGIAAHTLACPPRGLQVRNRAWRQELDYCTEVGRESLKNYQAHILLYY